MLAGRDPFIVDPLESEFAIRHDLEEMTGKRIPLSIMTDSESLFRVIVPVIDHYGKEVDDRPTSVPRGLSAA